MSWQLLKTQEQLEAFMQASSQKPVLFCKHSTRCSISSAALERMDRHADKWQDKVEPVHLDLLRYRELSDQLASVFDVEHASPQILLVSQGRCIYHTRHLDISWTGVLQPLEAYPHQA